MNRTLDNAHLTGEQMRQLLQSDRSTLEEDGAAQHLDRCEACQQALAGFAGDDPFWQMAKEHLSNGLQTGSADRPDSSFAVPLLDDSERWSRDNEPPVSASTLLEPPTHPEMLGRVDQFDVESCIGQGGMGVVYRGFDRELNRTVAIKFLSPHLASNATARARFAREARAAAAVVHPNVVPIHSIQSGGHPYLVMPYVPGRSLQRLVSEQGPLNELQIVRISIHVAGGLAAAHKQGLVHRDIKPSNILQDGDDGRALLTDFGLARAADDADMTQTGWLAGTPHYMSPEQTRGENLDHRSDLFSLGSVLYFLATGRAPFRAENSMAVLRKIETCNPLTIRSVNHEISGELEALIEWLMQKDPARRPARSLKFQQVCEGYLAHILSPADSPLPAELKTLRVRPKPRQLRAVLIMQRPLSPWSPSVGACGTTTIRTPPLPRKAACNRRSPPTVIQRSHSTPTNCGVPGTTICATCSRSTET